MLFLKAPQVLPDYLKGLFQQPRLAGPANSSFSRCPSWLRCSTGPRTTSGLAQRREPPSHLAPTLSCLIPPQPSLFS